ncbi:putative ABC transport system substrate-binding protein [Tissierella praeacuta]|uniref:ABC transporter substrate-binding protein n=1 Tax=Tissierella praeacuta TaxID=43131 RepID=UPI0010E31F17|nr:ABC transporter substrate-binding protein [Tissierella praeacuta]TCU74161.1 putative ABC transport system substrate-binding protein [Tissierella praeacuta]
MKKSKISKLVSLAVSGIVFLSGCNSNVNKPNSVSEEKIFKIGISQLADHPALDDARLGFEDGLKELGINAEIDYQNAQGDIPTTMSISQKFIKDKVDLIYAIATPAAQSAKQSTNDIPILFSAVTDPVVAELVDSMESPGGNVTGTSDASPMDRQLQLFKDLDSNIKKVGIIFNTSEPNSQVQVEMAKDLAPSIGLEIVEIGISSISDMPQAIDSIVKKVDGIYTITDNMVASAINIVSEKAISNKLITVGAEDSHVSGGILVTDGISYYELGKQTAQMAKEILVDKTLPSNIPSQTATNTKKVFNMKTLKALEIDENNEVFKDASKID